MATRKTNTTTKSRKTESTFDADKFLEEYEDKCRELDELYNAAMNETVTATPSRKKAKSGVDKKSTDTANHSENIITVTEPTVSATTDKATTTDDVTETVESTAMAKTATPITTTITGTTDKVTETMPDATVEEQSAKSPKSTRISGRMRRASRDEFCGTYTRKVDTKGGSPITIAPDILKMAHVICAKSGNYKSCPTYVINNILRAVFEDMADEIKSWPMPE